MKFIYKLLTIGLVFNLLVAISFVKATAPVAENKISDFVSPEEIERAKNYNTFIGRGAVEMAGMSGTFEIQYMAPDNIYMAVDLGVFKFSQGFDGETAWMRDQNNQVMELAGADRKQSIDAAYINGYAYLLEDRMPGRVVYYGDSTIDNKSYAIFYGYPAEGDSVGLYINKETKRLEIYGEQLDDISILSYSSDFRKIDGYEIAYRTDAVSNVPQLNSTMIFNEVIINGLVDKSIFMKSGGVKTDVVFPPDKSKVVVPFRYINGHIHIDGSVNEHKANFILDTGAGSNVVAKSFASEIGLNETGDLPSKGVAGYESVGLVEIDSLRIGDIMMTDQVVVSVDLGIVNTGGENDIVGILGYDLLSRFPLKISFVDSTITFYNPELFTPPGDEYGIDIEFEMRIPTIRAKYAGNEGKFLIDFGNASGLILHNSFIGKYNLKESFSDITAMSGGLSGIGGSAKAYAAIGGQLEFGPVVLEQTALLYTDEGQGITESVIIDGNIGLLILKDVSIVLDYGRKKMYVLPPEIK